ncbi:MAG: fatty acid desaturase [Burkholderiaceae bacterium]|nr:fatty acid desaturase [Burkholderiaceae bacterium]
MVNTILEFLDTGLLDFEWWQIVVYALVVTHITIAAVTIYLHRCQAHRALELHPIVSHFFRFWLWLTTGMVTRQWAAVHRKHHAKCETPEDPHSPRVYGLKKVLLEGVELYRVAAADKEIVEKYGHGAPDDWLERKLYTPYSFLGVYVTLAICLLLFGVSGLSVFAVQMLWIPVTAAGIINGLGHAKGYRNFDCPDASTNVFPWGILIGGEELHNNHHAYASSAKLSAKWYEFDIGWMYIRIMSMLGLAKVRRVLPRPRLESPKATIDAETLQAVITMRYDVMAQFARSLRNACTEEAERLRKLQRPEFHLLESARRWLPRDVNWWTEGNKAKLSEVLAASDRVKTLVEMRRELSHVWERSNLTREQLVSHLQAWCRRAEESGVHALQELALRVRRYSRHAAGGQGA